MTISAITLQQDILKELGRNPSDTLMQARALRWINKAMDNLQGFMPDVEFLQSAEMEITLVDGQAAYAMPTDFFYLSQVRIDEETRILDEYSREEFDRRHPDPANEEEDIPSDYTFEYDRSTGRHIIRFGPIPDDSYDCHGIIRRWHPSINASQGLQYDKLQTCLENGGIWEGSMSVYMDNEYTQIRGELKTKFLESVQALQQVLNMQKPRPRQIRTVLRREDY